MIVAGCDIGSTTGKAVIMKENDILSSAIVPCKPRPAETAEIAMKEAMDKAGMSSIKAFDFIVGTGYGRCKVAFADDNISEITCHGVGAKAMCDSVKTIIDIGGQDLKAIALDDNGKILDFAMNDKCAAGTGKFIENMARSLGLTLDDFSMASLQAKSAATISSQCSVFAESEIITLLNEGIEIADIAKGVHNAIASRIMTLVSKVGAREKISIVGGCAKNEGLIKTVEDKLNAKLARLPIDPQIVGALGAAALAARMALKKRRF